MGPRTGRGEDETKGFVEGFPSTSPRPGGMTVAKNPPLRGGEGPANGANPVRILPLCQKSHNSGMERLLVNLLQGQDLTTWRIYANLSFVGYRTSDVQYRLLP